MMIRTLLLATLLACGVFSAAQAESIIGADISHLPQLEAAGAKFYDHEAKSPEDLLQILKRNGVNRIRLKVWNEPGKYAEFPSDQSGPEGYNNPAHVVAMAKRAQAAGLQVMIDFHYSDGGRIRASRPCLWPGANWMPPPSARSSTRLPMMS